MGIREVLLKAFVKDADNDSAARFASRLYGWDDGNNGGGNPNHDPANGQFVENPYKSFDNLPADNRKRAERLCNQIVSGDATYNSEQMKKHIRNTPENKDYQDRFYHENVKKPSVFTVDPNKLVPEIFEKLSNHEGQYNFLKNGTVRIKLDMGRKIGVNHFINRKRFTPANEITITASRHEGEPWDWHFYPSGGEEK